MKRNIFKGSTNNPSKKTNMGEFEQSINEFLKLTAQDSADYFRRAANVLGTVSKLLLKNHALEGTEHETLTSLEIESLLEGLRLMSQTLEYKATDIHRALEQRQLH